VKKTLKRIGVIAGTAVAAPLAVGAIVVTLLSAYTYYQTAMLPQICKDLPDNVIEARDQFQARVRKEFAAPVPVEQLAALLEKQGFRRPSDGPAAEITYMSVYRQSFPCVERWSVEWQNGAGGIAHDIKGVFILNCMWAV
jgi:hypothetical protein